MSLPVFTWVLDHSDERLGNRLVLLTLAEHAHDDGTKAFPSIETLVKRTRLSERQARNCLRSLETNKAIEQTGTLKSGTRIYCVIGPFNGRQDLPGGQDLPGQSTTPESSRIAPEPSKEPSKGPSSSRTGRAPTQVGGKRVSSDEEAIAITILDCFNRISGRRFGSKETLGKIILRHREHPELTADDHERIIRQQFEAPWWKGDPSPAVIYGNGDVFDRALNGVRGSSNNDEDEQRRGFTRD